MNLRALSVCICILATSTAIAKPVSPQVDSVAGSVESLLTRAGELRNSAPFSSAGNGDGWIARTSNGVVHLPRAADGPVVIETEKAALKVTFLPLATGTLQGLRSLRGGPVVQAAVRADRDAPAGFVFRATRSGLEDYALFNREPASARLTYVVRLDGVAGLRNVGGVLEFLDSGGAPRLRVSRVAVIDSEGRVVPANLELEGCAADRDPRPPWGRLVTAPGSDECRIVVDWSAAQVQYPILVDPLWQFTSSLAVERHSHAQVTLQDGRVLVAGGGSNAGYAGVAELWDPSTSPGPPRAMSRFLIEEPRWSF